jgi:NADPH-dependent glutamate synthase beta subunit-like oxidoreductase
LQNQNLRKIIARLLNSNKDLKTEKNILQKENEFLRNVLKQIKYKNVKQPVKTK